MKAQLHALIDALTDSQVIFTFTFLSKLFGKAVEQR